MKNVLFIVTEPKSANGICCEAVMRELSKNNINVFCLTNREYGEKKEYIHNGIKYYTAKPRWVYRVESYLRKKRLSGLKYRIAFTILKTVQKGKLLLSYFSWPLISPIYAKRIYIKAKTICKKYNIDTIIPVYTQVDTLIAANRIKKKKPKIRYIPYFLDSFSGGYGPKIFSREWTIKRGIKWEHKLLPNADTIIMMKSSREHYEKYAKDEPYYKKIVFLDLPLFALHEKETEKKANNKIKLLYVGTIPVHIRNPEYFLKVFNRIEDNQLELTMVGTCTKQAMLEYYATRDSRIKLHPFVKHEEAIEMMNAADVLVNLGNNNPHMTPCKIFEYMSLKKPIISTAPIENEPSLYYLDRYPEKVVLNEYNANIERDAKIMHAFLLNSKTTNIEIATLKNEFYHNTPKAFYDIISTCGGTDK